MYHKTPRGGGVEKKGLSPSSVEWRSDMGPLLFTGFPGPNLLTKITPGWEVAVLMRFIAAVRSRFLAFLELFVCFFLWTVRWKRIPRRFGVQTWFQKEGMDFNHRTNISKPLQTRESLTLLSLGVWVCFFCPIGGGGKPRASLHLGDDQAISISKLSGVCQTPFLIRSKGNKQMEIH